MICGSSFEIKVWRNGRHSNSRVCSGTCRGKLAAKSKRPWTEEELQIIHEYAETLPSAEFIRNFNRINSENNRPLRTKLAICSKIYELGYCLKPNYCYFTPGTLSKLLGIHHCVVSNWLKLGLRHRKNRQIRRSPIYIKIEDVRKFALLRPELFSGIEYSNLFAALESETLAEQIANTYPKRLSYLCAAKPVRCLETGRTYKSIKHAGRAYRVASSTIARSIRNSRPVKSHHFVFAHESTCLPQMQSNQNSCR